MTALLIATVATIAIVGIAVWAQLAMAREVRAYRKSISATADHEHLCIPIRHWFRARWVCVRCDRTFREDVR